MYIYILNLYFVLIFLYFSRILDKKTDYSNCLSIDSRTTSESLGKSFIFLAFISLVLLSGLRYNVGTDYTEYVKMFQYIQMSDSIFSLNVEPIFMVIVKVISFISNDPLGMFLATSFFTIYFIFKAVLKYEDMYELGIFLFIAFGFYTNSFNLVRQWMAISLVLYAYMYLAKNQKKQFFMYIIIATMCHYSALVMIPVYFFIRKERKNFTRVIVMISGVVFFIFSNPIIILLQNITLKVPILNKYYRFLNVNQNIGGSILVFPLFCIIIYILYLVFTDKNKNKNNQMEIYINILSVGFGFSLMGQKFMVFNRLQLYFVIIFVVIIPRLITLVKEEDRVLLYRIIVMAGIVFYMYNLLQNGGQPLPYQTIFSK